MVQKCSSSPVGYAETAHLIGFNENNEIIELVDSSVRPFLLAKEFQNDIFRYPTLKHVERFNGIDKQIFSKISGYDASEDIPRIRNELENIGIKTFESDIYYSQVYMKERGFTPCSWHLVSGAVLVGTPHGRYEMPIYDISSAKIFQADDDVLPNISAMAMDGEMYGVAGGMPRVDKDPIILAGLVFRDEDGEREQIMIPAKGHYDDVLIEETADAIIEKNPVFMLTYNGNTFDWPYFTERAKLSKANFKISRKFSMPYVTEWKTISIVGRPAIDLFGIAKFVIPKGSRKSQPILHRELRKSDLVPPTKFVEINRDEIASLWDNPETRQKVIDHCASDVQMSMDIFEYAWNFIVELSSLTGIPPDQVLSVPYSVLVEGFLIKIAKEFGYVIPKNRYNLQPKTSGAFTMKPTRGIPENVSVFDFASMYPIILINKNISPETYVPNPDPVDIKRGLYHVIESDDGRKFYFMKSPEGFFVKAMKRLLGRISGAKSKYGEKKYKQKYAGEVQALKTIARSMYGYLKAPKSRWYLVEAQEAVACEGRNWINKGIKVADRYGYVTIYSDTDSLFLTGLTQKEGEEFAEILSEELGVKVGLDKFYTVLFFTEAKKKYAGLKPDGDVDYVGFMKSDWVDIANYAQKKVLDILLKEKDVDKAVEFSRMIAQGVRHNVFPLKKFIIWKRIKTQKLWASDYGKYAHVVVARKNPEKYIEEDGTVGYVVVKGVGNLSHKARHYSEVKSVEELDVEYYIKKQIGAVTNLILKYMYGDKDTCTEYAEL